MFYTNYVDETDEEGLFKIESDLLLHISNDELPLDFSRRTPWSADLKMRLQGFKTFKLYKGSGQN